jgi:hypothetical protein
MLSQGKPADLLPPSPHPSQSSLGSSRETRSAPEMPRPPKQGLADAASAPKRSGYGLPCMNCRTYYAAELSCCPVCQAPQQHSLPPTNETETASGLFSELRAVEAERERFVEEFRLRFTQSSTVAEADEGSACCLGENHQGAFEPARVCQECYRRALERVDIMEAALHMDVREAAQIVYQAVWADPSDPSRTYENAARALLTEIRRHAGVDVVLGSLRSFAH